MLWVVMILIDCVGIAIDRGSRIRMPSSDMFGYTTQYSRYIFANLANSIISVVHLYISVTSKLNFGQNEVKV